MAVEGLQPLCRVYNMLGIRGARRQRDINGVFPLHGMIRLGMARYGSAQLSSVGVSTAV